MVYGNTVSYTGGDAQNYASLASYLLCDITGQTHTGTGHAVNAVPIRENDRIPDIEEVIDAQLFAGRLIESAPGYAGLFDFDKAENHGAEIAAGGRVFFDNVLTGLAQAGVDTADAAEMLLALKRLGSKRLEQEFGAGPADRAALRGRTPLAPSPIMEEVEHMAAARISRIGDQDVTAVRTAGLKVLVATTDVHEHGKLVNRTGFCRCRYRRHRRWSLRRSGRVGRRCPGNRRRCHRHIDLQWHSARLRHRSEVRTEGARIGHSRPGRRPPQSNSQGIKHQPAG